MTLHTSITRLSTWVAGDPQRKWVALDDVLALIPPASAEPQDYQAADERLRMEGIFKGAEGLRLLAENEAFWSERPYGTRLYFGDDMAHYLHRDVLRAAVRALAAPSAAPSPANAEIEDLIDRLLDAQQDVNLIANETMSQTLCNVSVLLDEVETVLRRISAPSPASEQDAKDGARYRWLRTNSTRLGINIYIDGEISISETLDADIDAAMTAAQGGSKGE